MPITAPRSVRLALFALCLLAPATRAQEAPRLSSDLNLVPRDAAGFVHVRVADLWNNDAFADVRHILEHAGPDALRMVDRKLVPAPSTLDRISLVMLTPESWLDPFPAPSPVGVSALVVIATSKPFDAEQVRKAIGGRAKTFAGKTYNLNEKTWAASLVVDAQTLVIGSEDAIQLLLDRQKDERKDGPLADALREAALNKHIVTAALNPRPFADAGLAAQLPPALQPLLRANFALASLDLGKETRVALHLHYGNTDEAAAGEKAARALLDLGRAALQQPIRDMEQQLRKNTEGEPTGWQNLGETAGPLAALGGLRFADAKLKEAPLRRDGTTVGVAFTTAGVSIVQYSLPCLAAITALGQNAQTTFERVSFEVGGQSGADKLKQLCAAFENYQAEHGRYPSAAIHGKEGTPLLSWRVAILPCIGEGELYRQFKLDEPWDSAHNKKLLLRRPRVFDGSFGEGRWMTPVQAFTGPSTIFEGKTGIRQADVTDGLANTILLFSTTDRNATVPWTKPADVAVDAQPRGAWDWTRGNFMALFADGSVRWIRPGTPEKTIRAWITRNGGEKVKPAE